MMTSSNSDISATNRQAAPKVDIVGPIAPDGVYVCPLAAIDSMVETVGASHLMTLINLDTMPETPEQIAPGNHLKLGMNDISEPRDDLVLPGEHHIEELVGFVEGWDQKSPLVIHCWAGISRSTAAAFITLCHLNQSIDEVAVAQAMRDLSPTAYPNRRLVKLADDFLSRNGRMIEAVEAIGRGEMAMEGVIFGIRADMGA